MEEECEMRQSYYVVLGISTDSSNEEIRRAYRKLAMVSAIRFFCFLGIGYYSL